MRRLASIILLIGSLCGASAAQSAIIFESATLGSTGHNGGFVLSSQFLGVRFSLAQATQIDSIGGHLATNAGGTVWAALFSLADDTSALPTFGAADPSLHSLGHAILSPPAVNSSALVTAGLVGGPVVLGPGAYGIVIGDAGFYGTTDSGTMPTSSTTGATNIGSPNYFFRNGSGTWLNGGFTAVRFEVNGQLVSVPAPATALLLGMALLGLGLRARRPHAA